MTQLNLIKDAGVYVDPLSDWGWKTLFGSERYKEHLISFINAVYPELGVVDISYQNVEEVGDAKDSRSSRLDLACETEKGEMVIVEVQKAEQRYFFERGLWNTSFKIRDQAKKGEWDYHLKGVYSIGILTFSPEKIEDYNWNDNEYIHTFSIKEDITNERMTDVLRFAYISVQKFNKQPEELSTILEKWVYLLRNLQRLDGRPEELKDRVFERFFKAAEIAQMPKTEQDNYRASLMNENDWNNAITFAAEKATEKIAINLRNMGMPLADIAKATGLSESQIQTLK